jgi:PAS fold
VEALLEQITFPLVACAGDARVTHLNDAARMLVGCSNVVGTGPGLWMDAIRPRTVTGISIPMEDLPPLRALDGEHVRGFPMLVHLGGRDLVLEVSAKPLTADGRTNGAIVSLIAVLRAA